MNWDNSKIDIIFFRLMLKHVYIFEMFRNNKFWLDIFHDKSILIYH